MTQRQLAEKTGIAQSDISKTFHSVTELMVDLNA